MNPVKIKKIFMAVFLPLALFADPIVFLNDSFDDGERDTQNLPHSAHWLATHTLERAAQVISKDGNYVLAANDYTTDTGRGAIAYFTDNTETKAALTAEHNPLRFSFDFTANADTVGSEDRAVRFIIADSGSTRIETDTLGDVSFSGYMIAFNPGTGAIWFRTRDDVASNYMSSISRWDNQLSGESLLAMRSGVTYSMTIEIERMMMTGFIRITATMTDGINTAIGSWLDDSYLLYSFDTIGFYNQAYSGGVPIAGRIDFDNVQVTLDGPRESRQRRWQASSLEILNPYADVDWNTFERHKANLHSHTIRNRVMEDGSVIYADQRIVGPDGNEIQPSHPEWRRNNPSLNWHPDIPTMDETGISSECSDGSDGRGHTDVLIDFYHQNDYSILAITDHDKNTWPWTKWHRDPDELGMLAVRGNEASLGHHLVALFTTLDYPDTRFTDPDRRVLLNKIGEDGGLAIIAHPGYYAPPERDRYMYDIKWYVDLFREMYDVTNGVEAMNSGNVHRRGRRCLEIWDSIQAEMMPEMPVWGYGPDDTHSAGGGRVYDMFYLPGLTEENLRGAIRSGHSTFSYEQDRLNHRAPQIQSITVDSETHTIHIETEEEAQIFWVADYKYVATGPSVDSLDLYNQGRVNNFIRAEIVNDYGITYTQPFGVKAELFVPIEDPDNEADTSGYGAVSYTYHISKHPVNIANYALFYEDSESGKVGAFGSDYDWWNSGGRDVGVNAPAVNISFHQAAQYCNWLTTGSATEGVYTINGAGEVTGIDRRFRNEGGTAYALPSPDEWYKAAYFTGSGYSLYADGTDTPPLLSGDGVSGWNYANTSTNWTSESSPWSVHSGSEEQNGTLNMAGDLREWLESLSGQLSPGDYSSDADQLASTAFPAGASPAQRRENSTFRVVMISGEPPLSLPEGSVVFLNTGFDNGSMDVQDLPDNAQWFTTHTHLARSAEIVDDAGNYVLALNGYTTSPTLRGAAAYFTDDTATKAVLTPENSRLVWSFDFRASAPEVGGLDRSVRFAIMSADSRIEAETAAVDAEFTGKGYMLAYNPESGDFWIRNRNTTDSNNFVSNIGTWDNRLSGSTTEYKMLQMEGGTWYSLEIELERLLDDTVQFTWTMSERDGTESATFSWIDETYLAYEFDTIAMVTQSCETNPYRALTERLDVDNLKVILLGDEPSFEDWAAGHGLSGDDADPGLDFDGDGFTNWQEYIADTDPTSDTSFLSVESITRDGSMVGASFHGSSSRLYELWFTPDLTGENGWERVQGPRTGAGGADSMIHEQEADSPSGFYRLRVLLP